MNIHEKNIYSIGQNLEKRPLPAGGDVQIKINDKLSLNLNDIKEYTNQIEKKVKIVNISEYKL